MASSSRRRRQEVWRIALAALAFVVMVGCGTAGRARTESDGPPAGTGANSGASASSLAGALTVFAAASLTEPFTEIRANLEAANPELTVTLNFAGSSQLRAQLAQGARADVFASADEQNMAGARDDGVIAGEPRVFARNKLVVVAPEGNPAGITTLGDLARPGVKLVLAQPQVPAGNYSRQVLEKLSQDSSFGADYEDKVLANLVSDEANVKSVLAKVQLGEADAGIVYVTDITVDAESAVTTIAIPDRFNIIAEYPVAPVVGAANEANGQAFIDYLLSPAGQEVLARYGFGPAVR